MGSKMTLAMAVAGAVTVAAAVLPGTSGFGYTPRHPFGAYWLYARPHCARYQQFLPMTGGIVYHGIPCR
jgi:hypothetical protein